MTLAASALVGISGALVVIVAAAVLLYRRRPAPNQVGDDAVVTIRIGNALVLETVVPRRVLENEGLQAIGSYVSREVQLFEDDVRKQAERVDDLKIRTIESLRRVQAGIAVVGVLAALAPDVVALLQLTAGSGIWHELLSFDSLAFIPLLVFVVFMWVTLGAEARRRATSEGASKKLDELLRREHRTD